MADPTPAALAGELLLGYRKGTLWRAHPDLFGLAAALEALAVMDETLFDIEDQRVPAVRAVRTDRIIAIAAELRGVP